MRPLASGSRKNRGVSLGLLALFLAAARCLQSKREAAGRLGAQLGPAGAGGGGAGGGEVAVGLGPPHHHTAGHSGERRSSAGLREGGGADGRGRWSSRGARGAAGDGGVARRVAAELGRGAGGAAEARGTVRGTAELEGPPGGDPEAPGAAWLGAGGTVRSSRLVPRVAAPPVTGPSPPRGPRVSGDMLLPPGLGASSRAPTAGGGTRPSGGSPGPAPRAPSGCPVRPRPSRRYQSRKPTGR